MWIPVVEKLPAERTVVIVGQSNANGYRNFAGWLSKGVWYSFFPQHPNSLVSGLGTTEAEPPPPKPETSAIALGFDSYNSLPSGEISISASERTVAEETAFIAEMGDLRATDFWLSLPEWPPGDTVVRHQGYPA
jgi:hypothetical protein